MKILHLALSNAQVEGRFVLAMKEAALLEEPLLSTDLLIVSTRVGGGPQGLDVVYRPACCVSRSFFLVEPLGSLSVS